MANIEENLRIISEELKKLETISYDEIVDMLSATDAYYQINFYDQHDVIGDIHYSCVSVLKNNDTDTVEEYLTADQNVRAVYNNLIKALEKKFGSDFIIQVSNGFGSYFEMYCFIGDNLIMFPKKPIKELIGSATEQPSDPNCIPCVLFAGKECFLPKSLEIEDEKTKTGEAK